MSDFFVAEDASEIPLLGRPHSVVIGNFDGVHLGHQKLLSHAVSLGQKWAVPTVVFTFNPHPLAVLRPPHLRLFDLEDQRQRLKEFHVDGVFYQAFSRDFSQLSALDFLDQVMAPLFAPKALVVGFNFRFGSSRGGSLELLRQWCKRQNCELEVVDPVQLPSGSVSTSEIRKALASGQVNRASEILGRPYSLSGIVIAGETRGRGLGFPTANTHLENVVHPVHGVYATITTVRGKRWGSVSHLGPLPTFNDGVVRLETHLLDFDQDIYGEKIKVEFIEQIRGVQKFTSVDELRKQIQDDCLKAREKLRGLR